MHHASRSISPARGLPSNRAPRQWLSSSLVTMTMANEASPAVNQQWFDLFVRSISPHVVAEDSQADDPRAFTMEITDIQLSTAVDADTLRIYLSLYNFSRRQVIGRSCNLQNIVRNMTNQTEFQVNQSVIFAPTTADVNLSLLVQVISSRGGGDEGRLVGWVALFPFRDDNLHDTPHRFDLYGGAPTILLGAHQPSQSLSRHRSKVGFLTASLKHNSIATDYSILRCIQPNAILHSGAVIPGLQAPTPDGSVSLVRPAPTPVGSFLLQDVAISLFDGGLERDLCSRANAERLLRTNQQPDGSNFVVSDRRLHIGIHNGWTWLMEPVICHLKPSLRRRNSTAAGLDRGLRNSPRSRSVETPQAAAPQAAMYFVQGKGSVQLEELPVNDPSVAVLFLVEFCLSLSPQNEAAAPSPSYALGWGAWCPYASNQWSSETMSLRSAASLNPFNRLFYRFDATTVTPLTLSFGFLAASELPKQVQPTPIYDNLQRPPVQPAPPKPGPVPTPKTPTQPAVPVSKPSTEKPAEVAQPVQPPPPVPDRTIVSEPVKEETIPPPTFVQPVYVPVADEPTILPFQPETVLEPDDSQGKMKETPHYEKVIPPVLDLKQQHDLIRPLSRAAYAHLSQLGLPDVVDRLGNAAQLVDATQPRSVDLNAELTDDLSTNEIVLQFMGMAKSPGGNIDFSLPRSVFFTFQFYRFPLTSTERLGLYLPQSDQPFDEILYLRREDDNSAPLTGVHPGYQVKFIVDPYYMHSGERRYFLRYMAQHRLHIDVWDAASLMLIGSATVPLRPLLRAQRDAVYSLLEVPVVWTDMQSRPTSDHAAVTVPHARLQTILYLKAGNSGYPPATSSRGSEAKALSRNPAAVVQQLTRLPDRTLATAARDVRTKTRTTAQSLFSESPELREALLTGKRSAFVTDELGMEHSDERRRKLKRLEALADSTLAVNAADKSADAGRRAQLSRDLTTIKMMRERQKHDSITVALSAAITTLHHVYPTFGAAEFFEFALTNPLQTAATVDIDISNPAALQLVTDMNEWNFFKRLHGLQTPLEANMLARTGEVEAQKENIAVKGTHQLFLRPREKIYLPFKYQSFAALNVVNPPWTSSADAGSAVVAQECQTMQVVFTDAASRAPLAYLVLCVTPQPHSVTSVYRFHVAERSFLARLLRPASVLGIKAARASDPNVLCEVDANGDVFVKAAAGTAPQVNTFCLLLYADSFHSIPVEIWQMHVHAVQRLEATVTQGHVNRVNLLIKGTASSRNLCCYTSSSREVNLRPCDPFMLNPNESTELTVLVQPMTSGERTLEITCVDIGLKQLLHAWLLDLKIQAPAITRAFKVVLPIGKSHKHSKRISVTNPYSVARRFHLVSSNERVMQIATATPLTIEGSANSAVALQFAPHTGAAAYEIYLFLNNKSGSNEMTYAVQLSYARTAT